MSKQFIVVDRVEDWEPFYPSENIITFEAYQQQDPSPDQAAQIINLCRDYKYMGRGYYCSLLAEAVIWDLTDAIASRDPDRALATAHRMLEGGARGEAHRLIGMVSWQLRRLLQLQDAMEHGGSVSYNLPGWKRKKIEAALRSSPLDEAAIMARVARANQDMNSHRAGDRRVFEGLLLDLVSR